MRTIGPIYYLLWSPVIAITRYTPWQEFQSEIRKLVKTRRSAVTLLPSPKKNPSELFGGCVSSRVLCYPCVFGSVLLRGTVLNRTYGTHKNLYISRFLLTTFDPIYYGSP